MQCAWKAPLRHNDTRNAGVATATQGFQPIRARPRRTSTNQSGQLWYDSEYLSPARNVVAAAMQLDSYPVPYSQSVSKELFREMLMIVATAVLIAQSNKQKIEKLPETNPY